VFFSPRSEKAALTKHLEKGDDVSLKSVSPSENVSLPDLLQPEFVYKKQTDTGLD
jgi:hypothetical protein